MDAAFHQLLDHLSDGQVHSGEALAHELGISRTAIWKRIQGLRELGLEITAVSGEGYRLTQSIQRLDIARIRDRLDDPALSVEVRALVDSSNACLNRERADHPPPRALIAEAQSQGRGRRGRTWVSPPGAGLYLSLSWPFESGLLGLSSLSLVTGLTVAQVLNQHGLEAVGVKWPNDLVVGQEKLGGCLIEISGSAEGPCEAIAGVGLNCSLGQNPAIDQPWTDLERQGLKPDHDALCADLITALSAAYARLDQQGFEPYSLIWDRLDALRGRRVRIDRGNSLPLEGTARGVDAQGRLRLYTDEGLETIANGEASVRAV
ncbi:MAG: biotin--[acetyl-CoA-carboxylase] ligase [Pseudomonadota bacterium]